MTTKFLNLGPNSTRNILLVLFRRRNILGLFLVRLPKTTLSAVNGPIVTHKKGGKYIGFFD